VNAISHLPIPASDNFFNQPININEEASVNQWVTAFDCSELELRMAVAEVGPVAKDVGNELGKVL
jgi:Protein of unknown function (DUF3606)